MQTIIITKNNLILYNDGAKVRLFLVPTIPSVGHFCLTNVCDDRVGTYHKMANHQMT